MNKIYYIVVCLIALVVLVACDKKRKRPTNVLMSPSVNMKPNPNARIPLTVASFDGEKANQRTRAMLLNYRDWKSSVTSMHLEMNANAHLPKSKMMKRVGLKNDIYLLKDSAIWITSKSTLLGSEVLQAIFQKDRILLLSSFMQPNRLSLDYTQLQSRFGVLLSFEQLQDIFFLQFEEQFTIDESSTVDNVNVMQSLTTDSTMQSFIRFSLPYQYSSNFPNRYDMEYTLTKENQQYEFLITQIITEGNKQLQALQMDIKLNKSGEEVFSVKQKSVKITINEPFELPNF